MVVVVGTIDTMVLADVEKIPVLPLVRRGDLPSESHACDSGGRKACTITSLGKNERDVANTIPRSSSPRREGHRGRPRGSAASVPSASNASTMRFAAMSGTAFGEG
jgi:hypothetical protein